MQKANAKNPWRGMMGQASFVLPLETALIQASSATGMKTLAQTTPSVADSEVVAASLAGLKAVSYTHLDVYKRQVQGRVSCRAT